MGNRREALIGKWLNSRYIQAYITGIIMTFACYIVQPIEKMADAAIMSENDIMWSPLYFYLISFLTMLGIFALIESILKRYGFKGFTISKPSEPKSSLLYISFFIGCFTSILCVMVFALLHEIIAY